MASLYFGTTNEKISGLFVFTLGAAPGATYLAQANSAGLNATAQALINATGASTTSALADIILAKLGVPSTDTAAKAEVLAFLGGANASVANAGAGLVSLLNAVTSIANPSSPLYATYGSYASTFVSNLETAAAYSSVSTNTSTDLSTLQTVVSTASAPTGTTFNLTTNADDLTGTSYADTFRAVTDDGQTFESGDVVDGGAGTDTLVITAGGSAASVVTLDSVEIVDVRLLSATTLNAVQWSGTTNVEITNNSINDVELTVTNASFETTFTVKDDDDLEVNWLDASGSADNVNLAFDGIGQSSDFVLIDVGSNANGIESVSATVAGVNYIDVETGASATAMIFAGTGTLNLRIDDAINTLSLVGFSGTAAVSAVDIVTNLAVTGGAGDDTVYFGTQLNANDSFNGGSGSDAIHATINNSSVNLRNVTNVESGTFDFSGTTATLAFSGTNFSTINLANGSATAVTLNDLGANTFVNLKDDGLENVTIDTLASKTASVVVAATVGGDYGTLTVTDAVTVSIGNSSDASGAQELGTITLDGTDTKHLNVSLGGSADLKVSGANVIATNLDDVSITVANSASFRVSGGSFLDTATSLNSLTLIATGDDGNDIHLGSGIIGSADQVARSASFALVVSATDAAQVFAEGIKAHSSTLSISVNLGAGSQFGDYSADTGFGSGFDILQSGTTNIDNFTVTVGASAAAAFGDIELGSASSTISDMNLVVGQSGSISFSSGIDAKQLGNITILGAGSANFDVIAVSTIGEINVSGLNGLTISTISAGGSIGNITLSGSGATLSDIDAATIGDITLNNSGTVSFAAVSANTIGVIDARGMANDATLTMDLSTVTTGVTISLGKGTNTIYSTDGDDSITLAAATGVDKVFFNTTGDATDQIYNFETDTDIIGFASGTSFFGSGIFSSGTAFTSAVDFLAVSSLATASGMATGADNVIVLMSGSFGTISDVMSAISTGGSLEIQGDETTSAGADILVIWTDGTDSHLTVVTLGSAVASGGGIFQTTDTTTEITTLYGVGYSALASLTASNIDVS